jgi:hypothetical protein
LRERTKLLILLPLFCLARQRCTVVAARVSPLSNHPPFRSLGAELAHEQDRALGERSLSELDLLRGLGKSRRRTTQSYARVAIVLTGLLIALITAITIVAFRFPLVGYVVTGPTTASRPSDSADTQFGRWVAAPASEPRIVQFTDGSTIQVAAETHLRVLGTDRRGAHVALEIGSIGLAVATSRIAEYLVAVGPFTLVMGEGRAEASWDPSNEQLNLIVHDGYVVIIGCQFGRGRSVMAGKELSTHCTTR